MIGEPSFVEHASAYRRRLPGSLLVGYDETKPSWRIASVERGEVNSDGTAVTQTTETQIAQKETWDLDQVGNWQEWIKKTGGTNTSYPKSFNAANEITSSGFAHDARGNLVEKGGVELFSYDIENRLSRTYDSMSVLRGEIYYDALGRRIRRVKDPGGSSSAELYIWDPGHRLLEIRDDSDDHATHRFIHAGPNGYIDDHIAFDLWDSGGSSWDRYYVHNDRQYSPLAVSDENGDVAERYLFDPYGTMRTYDASYANAQGTSRIDNRLLFQGLMRDGAGRYLHDYARARSYNPEIGRFLQRDPIGYRGGLNLYEAFAGNPLVHSDPSGEGPPGGSRPPFSPNEVKMTNCVATCVALGHLLGYKPSLEFCAGQCYATLYPGAPSLKPDFEPHAIVTPRPVGSADVTRLEHDTWMWEVRHTHELAGLDEDKNEIPGDKLEKQPNNCLGFATCDDRWLDGVTIPGYFMGVPNGTFGVPCPEQLGGAADLEKVCPPGWHYSLQGENPANHRNSQHIIVWWPGGPGGPGFYGKCGSGAVVGPHRSYEDAWNACPGYVQPSQVRCHCIPNR